MSRGKSKVRTFARWLFQTRPLVYPDKTKALLCFFFLSAFSLLAQAIRWAIPTLQASGLQCSSCGDQNDANYETCSAQCMDLSDFEMGVLSGPAFSLSMMIASIPLGYLADKVSRVRLVWMLSLVWSIGALASAVSDGFWQLLFSCILIGVAAACLNPCAFSLLADYFSVESRSFVISAFSAVIFIGYDAGLVTGVVSQYLSWRWAFTFLAIPGFLIFFPSLVMREPTRGLSEQDLEDDDFTIRPLTEDFDSHFKDEDDEDGMAEVIHDGPGAGGIISIFKSVPFLCIWVGATLRLLGGFALGGWIPSFYRRVFGLEPWEISLYLSIVLTIGGLCGSYVGGFVADIWSRKSSAGKIWLVLVSTIISIPFITATLLLPSVYLSLLCLLIASFFGEMWFGSSAAAVQDLIEPNLRGVATAVYLMGIGIGGISPALVGYLIQLFAIPAPHGTMQETAYDPTYPMLIVIVLMYTLSCIAYALTGLTVLREQRRRLDDGFAPGQSNRHTISLDDSAWGED